MKIRFFAIIILLFFALIEVNKFLNNRDKILSKEEIQETLKLQSGDIILRKEDNELSDFFATLDSNSYSHIGLVADTQNGLRVFHIEVDEKNDGIKVQTIKDFAFFATKIAVYRYKDKIDENRLLDILNDYLKKDVKFDYLFELDNEKLYCTELINDIYFKLFGENLYTYLYEFSSKKGVSINSIIKNPKLEKRFEFDL